ncbi:hypothetical protein F503_07623 [Ophiostoma piceae UAMH 11346]|uniref:Uncharacterized protein n=1 Tax=Ophiostoma piceae (strain UAMH 11346) TaxID=1262450 RepID=S3CAE8_OPHP1|nr:hypothetical protein F503_07623 [Ophiostoma piceae UAMH 11346]
MPTSMGAVGISPSASADSGTAGDTIDDDDNADSMHEVLTTGFAMPAAVHASIISTHSTLPHGDKLSAIQEQSESPDGLTSRARLSAEVQMMNSAGEAIMRWSGSNNMGGGGGVDGGILVTELRRAVCGGSRARK